MLHPNFIFVTVLINVFGSFSYLSDTLKGKTKPNRITWFLWALFGFSAFAAQMDQGVGMVALMTFMASLNPFLVFLASFVNKKAYWNITKLDVICGLLSIVGLILWQTTSVGNFAILFSILADGLAGVPTIVKSYKAPETENYKLFLAGAISAAITLLTVKVWNFATYGFALYILLICLLLFVLIRFKIGKRFSSS